MRRRSVCTLCLIGVVLTVSLPARSNRTGAQELPIAPPPVPVPASSAPASAPASLAPQVHDVPAAAPATQPAALDLQKKVPEAVQTGTDTAGSARTFIVTGSAAKPPALIPVKEGEPGPGPREKPPAFRLVEPPVPLPPPLPPVPPARILAVERLKTLEKQASPAPMTASSPVVALEKMGPPALTLNKPASYEIVLRNLGAAPAIQVHVEDQLPPDSQYLTAVPQPESAADRLVWNLGTLEAGAERRIRVEFVATRDLESLPAALVAFSVVPRDRITSYPGQPEPRREPARVFLKTSGPASVTVGQPAIFQIEVSNTGDAPAAGLKLHDRLSAGLRHPQGNEIEADLAPLGPHETRKIMLSALATSSGRQVSETSVLAPDGTSCRAETAVEVTEAGLRVSQFGPANGWVGQEVEFRIDVSNPGPTNVTSLRLRDVLPPGLEFVAAPDSGEYDAGNRCVSWLVGVLPAGQARALVLKLKPTTPGEMVNRVSAVAEQGPEVRSEAVLKVGGVAALGLDVNNPERQVEIGKETIYEIRVVNRGGIAGTGIQLLATVPDGMVPSSGAGQTSYRIQGQQVIFAPLARLEAGSEASFRVMVRCLSRGDKRFRAQITSDQSPLPLCRDEVTLVYSDRN